MKSMLIKFASCSDPTFIFGIILMVQSRVPVILLIDTHSLIPNILSLKRLLWQIIGLEVERMEFHLDLKSNHDNSLSESTFKFSQNFLIDFFFNVSLNFKINCYENQDFYDYSAGWSYDNWLFKPTA